MPTRRTPRKDRAAVDSAVVFTARESFSPGRLPTRKHEVLVGRLLLAGLAQFGKESLSQRVARIEMPPTLRGFQLVPHPVMALLRLVVSEIWSRFHGAAPVSVWVCARAR